MHNIVCELWAFSFHSMARWPSRLFSHLQFVCFGTNRVMSWQTWCISSCLVRFHTDKMSANQNLSTNPLVRVVACLLVTNQVFFCGRRNERLFWVCVSHLVPHSIQTSTMQTFRHYWRNHVGRLYSKDNRTKGLSLYFQRALTFFQWEKRCRIYGNVWDSSKSSPLSKQSYLITSSPWL